MEPSLEKTPKISDKLQNKTATERASIKGVEIAKVIKNKKYKLDKKTGLWN